MKTATALPCPCGAGASLTLCCGRWSVQHPAPDAETLMRSRYSAYVRGDVTYLLQTWHPQTRPPQLDFDSGLAAPRWLGLPVLRHQVTGPDTAEVAFVARYSIGGRAHRLHEVSRFRREAQVWLYVDGTLD